MNGIRKGNKSSHGAKCYAAGGRVSEDISDEGSLPVVTGAPGRASRASVEGAPAATRMDRAAKKPATTNVNIIVAGGKGEAPAAPPMPVPVPAPMAAPKPAMPPVAPPMGGAMPPGGMPMRASGGRVNRADGGRVYVPRIGLKEMARGDRFLKGKADISTTQSEPTPSLHNPRGNAIIERNTKMRSEVTTPTKRAADDERGVPGRKHGGRVMAKGEGAGGGLGRLEKIKGYGDKAGKPAKGS